MNVNKKPGSITGTMKPIAVFSIVSFDAAAVSVGSVPQ